MVGRDSITVSGKVAYILTMRRTRFDRALQERLAARGWVAKMVNPLLLSKNDLMCAELLVNRIPPSAVYKSGRLVVAKAMKLLSEAEDAQIATFPSLHTSHADYSKYNAYRLMRADGVPTPLTRLCPSRPSRVPRLPVIVKPNTSGFGRRVRLIRSKREWRKFSENAPASLKRGMVLQSFVKSKCEYDFRVTVLHGATIEVRRRTLLHGWLGCESRGARAWVDLAAPEAVICLALRASDAIQAGLNAVDIVLSKKGPFVIENNATPALSAVPDRELVLIAERVVGDLLSTRIGGGRS